VRNVFCDGCFNILLKIDGKKIIIGKLVNMHINKHLEESSI